MTEAEWREYDILVQIGLHETARLFRQARESAIDATGWAEAAFEPRMIKFEGNDLRGSYRRFEDCTRVLP